MNPMKQYRVTFLPAGITVPVEEGTTLLQAEIQAGLKPYAPCGGNRDPAGNAKSQYRPGQKSWPVRLLWGLTAP